MPTTLECAQLLAREHLRDNLDTLEIWMSPDPNYVRLVEVSTAFTASPAEPELMVLRFSADPPEITYPSELAVVSVEEFNELLKGNVQLPSGWAPITLLAKRKPLPSLIDYAAAAAHECNRFYCLAIGDASQPPWDDAPEWQKASARAGVEAVMRGATPKQIHQSWLEYKEREGWTYGPVKDADSKQHPCMVPYEQLPEEQRHKDELYGSVVRAMCSALSEVVVK